MATSIEYVFLAQTLETVKNAADDALLNMAVTNDTTMEDVMKVVADIITNGQISAAWSAESGKGFTLTPGSVGSASGTEGSITGTIILTQEGKTIEVKVNMTIAPLFTATFTGGEDATGTAPSPQEKLKAGATITLPANPFRISGKAFTGWSDGTSTYASGTTYTVPKTNVTFIAQWSEDVWDGSNVSTTLVGKGTETEPYLIYNSADFAYFQGKNMPHARLMADIDLGDHAFTAIKELYGTFDGNGYTIRNLNLAKTDLVYTGLFQQAGNTKGACIKNLTIEDALISYSLESGSGYLGILVGQTLTSGLLTVSDCYVTGTINSGTPNHLSMGGLIGRLRGGVTIENCYAEVAFTGTYAGNIGGLVGSSEGVGNVIRNSYAIPTLSMTKAPGYYGGIMGGGSGDIQKCYAAGQSLSLPGVGNISGISPTLAISDSVSIFTEMDGKQRITGNSNTQTLSNNYGYVGTLMRDYKGNILTPPVTEFAADKAQGADATKEQLESQEFYQNTLGWDFNSTWKMVTDYKYPVLKGQTILPTLALDMTQTVEGVKLDKTTATLTQNGTLQLTATVDITNGASRDVSWRSSDSANVTVDQNGNVTVLGNAVAGNYTITAISIADSGKFASCTITVNTETYSLEYKHDGMANSPDAIAAFYATAEDAQKGTNPITVAKSGTMVYAACTGVNSADVVNKIGILGTEGSKAQAITIDKYRFSFVMPCANTTVTVGYAESLNAYNYVWFVGKDWGTWGTTATYQTQEWSSGLGFLKVTDIINGKEFDGFDIKSVSLYNGGTITMTENKSAKKPADLNNSEYCILYDESGLPTLHVKLTGAGTIVVDIKVKDDPSAVYNVLQDSASSSYFGLDKATARAGEKVTATLTAAAVEQLTGDKTGKTTATLTYYGGLLVVLFPPVFTQSDGKWTASFTMPAQDVTTKVYFSKKTMATLSGTNKTVDYDGTPQTINSHITIMLGNTDASNALNGQYEVTYTGISGTSYAESTTAPTDVGMYSCTVKFPDNHPLYFGMMEKNVTLKIEKSKPKKPAAPMAADRTETSITLAAPNAFSDGTAIPGGYTFEYRRSGLVGANGGWQTSPVFDGLNATSSYSFYARIAENDNSNPSDESAATTVATLTGAPAVSSAEINYTMETVSFGELYEMSSVSGFESGNDITSKSSITGYIGKTIYIRLKAAKGQPASEVTAVRIPTRPTGFTAPRIDFAEETLTVLDTMQYKIGEGQYADGSEVAIDITDNIAADSPSAIVTYYLKATDAAFKSAENTMEIPARPATPTAPTASVENITDTSITLTTVVGCEYSEDESNWTTDTKFENRNPNTEYTFYQRVKATTDTFASEQSSSTIKSAKKQVIVSADNQTMVINGAFPTFTVTYEGFIGSENENNAALETLAVATTDTDGTTSGEFDITFKTLATLNTGASENYEIIHKTGTLTVSSNGSGGGSTGGFGTITPPSVDAVNKTIEAVVKIESTIDDQGHALVEVNDKMIKDAINEAKKNGNKNDEINLVLNVETGNKAVNEITVNLPKSVQEQVIKAKIMKTLVEVDNPDIQIMMNLDTITEINKQAKSDVSLNARKVTDVGNRPAFDLTVNYGNNQLVKDFKKGNVSVSIPYTLQNNEVAGNVYAIYVDGNNQTQRINASSYDSFKKVLRFTTNHFTTFGVGYKQNAPSYTDITNHWAKEDIQYVTARGLLTGSTATTFSPDASVTRGMLVRALAQLADVDEDAYGEWAIKNKILSKNSSTISALDQTITREEMAMIFNDYAKSQGFTLPKAREAIQYTDDSIIDAQASVEVKNMQMAGIIMGKDKNKFEPKMLATKAEASAALHRYIELILDFSTAQGFDKNDSGSVLYYEAGKPVIGHKTILGKDYEFGNDGILIKKAYPKYQWVAAGSHWYYLIDGVTLRNSWIASDAIGSKWYYVNNEGQMVRNTTIDGCAINSDGVWIQ